MNSLLVDGLRPLFLSQLLHTISGAMQSIHSAINYHLITIVYKYKSRLGEKSPSLLGYFKTHDIYAIDTIDFLLGLHYI